MIVLVVVATGIAGGVGAVLRFVIDGLVQSRTGARFPLGTLIINISGSLGFGLITGLAASHLLPTVAAGILGTGLMGGYTTFSTASVDVVNLIRAERFSGALWYAAGTLVAGVLAGFVGLAVGLLIAGR